MPYFCVFIHLSHPWLQLLRLSARNRAINLSAVPAEEGKRAEYPYRKLPDLPNQLFDTDYLRIDKFSDSLKSRDQIKTLAQ